jgi:hypothetical protein
MGRSALVVSPPSPNRAAASTLTNTARSAALIGERRLSMATITATKSSDPPQWFTNVLKYVLRTPLHGIFSKSIMLLECRGRKTGRVYRIPVSYLREGDVVTAFTDSPWQRNLLGGAPVTVYLKGKAVEGFAEVIDDRDAVTKALTHHLRRVRFDARFYGVSFDTDGQPIREQVERGSQHHVLLKIHLSAPSLSPATQR